MQKEEFIKRRIPYNKHISGGISLNTVDSLPEGVKPLSDVKLMYNYSGRIENDIVFFVKNIENKYYIELTNENTNETEIVEHIKRGIIFW